MNAMNTNQNPQQQATIRDTSGKVQVLRDGFFIPAQVGMALLPGDRIISAAASKALVQFTGVADSLVVEEGAAATFKLQVLEANEPAQWVAADLFGEGVYFEGQAPENTGMVANGEEPAGLFGLFGGPEGETATSSSAESTGYPVLESIAFLGATAAIYSDNEDNDNTTTNTTTPPAESGGGSTPVTPTPNPEPEPEPAAGPLDAVLEPVTSLLDGLLGGAALPAPLSTLAQGSSLPEQLPVPQNL